MVQHIIKTILWVIAVTLNSVVNGQSTTPPGTYNTFVKSSKAFNAVKLTVHKTSILYNSFDMKDMDTTYTIETIYGVREGKKLRYFIDGKVRRSRNNFNSWNHIYIKDTLAYSYDTTTIWRLDQDEIRYFNFPDCFAFLGNGNDTLLWFANDTFINNPDGGFTHIHHYEGSEYGAQTSVQTFQFDSRGIMTGKQVYFDQKNVIPKFYTVYRYSDVIYYKKVPRSFRDKIKNETDKAIALSKKKKKKAIQIINYYTRKSGDDTVMVDSYVTGKGEKHALDSMIRTHRLTAVYFWFDGCAPCRLLKPHLADIYNEFSNKGFTIIGLNDVDPSETIDTAKSVFYNFADQGGIKEKLFVTGYPAVLLFDSQNRLLGHLEGYNKTGIENFKAHIAGLLKE